MAHVPPQNEVYSTGTGGKKAGQTGAAVGGAAGVSLALINIMRSAGVSFWEADQDKEAVLILTTILSAIIRFGTNWFKNRNKGK